MTLQTKPETYVNLASLANHVVVGIGLMLRKRTKSRDVIDQGIGLCDRLLAIANQGEPAGRLSEDAGGRRRLHSPDTFSRLPANVPLDKIALARDELLRLGKENEAVSDPELRTVQHLFVQATTVDWLQCASDFQQRRLKRGLKPSL